MTEHDLFTQYIIMVYEKMVAKWMHRPMKNGRMNGLKQHLREWRRFQNACLVPLKTLSERGTLTERTQELE